MRKAEIMKYKSAITKADFLVTLVCIILAFLNLGGLSSMGRERARRMVCAVNMARLAQANHVYANNWDEQFCPGLFVNGQAPDAPPSLGVNYYRKNNWLGVPDFREIMALDEKQVISGGLVLPKEYQCPSNILFKEGRASVYYVLVSYAYNITDFTDEMADVDYWSCTAGPSMLQMAACHKRTAVKNASGKINFTESSDWWCVWWAANYVKGWDIVGQGNWEDYEAIAIWGPTLYRHNEGVNLAFYDGHVEWMPKGKVFIDTDGSLKNGDVMDATGMWYVEWPDW